MKNGKSSDTQLRDLFLGLQKELKAKLESGANAIGHPGMKGNNSEVNWLEMLNTYLPRRYHAESAVIVDADGNVSDQIDIVIFDAQFTPPLFQSGGVRFITAESVYAVLEVKQDLSKDHLNYAADKAQSVRSLKRTSVEINHAGGKFGPKEPHHILAGILTLRTSWQSNLNERLQKNCHIGDAKKQIDFGCCLEVGAFDIYDDGKVKVSSSEIALASFFWTMLAQLQTIGTVPAIDIRAYTRKI